MKRDQGLRFMLQKQVVLCLIAIFIIGIGYIRVKPVAAEVATNDTAWSESKAMSFLITANSDFIEYTIDMSGTLGWTGTLKQLRIDPNTAPSGSFSIDYIRISSE